MTRIRLALVGLGAAVMAYAVWGALTDPEVRPLGVVIFLAAVLVGHDAVWMPAVLLAGLGLSRTVPRRYRNVARMALIVAAAVTVVALPLVLGFGRAADNPSILPLPYGWNLLGVLAGIVAVAVLAAVLRSRKKSETSGDRGSGADDQ